jgi:hypothetical protein
MSPTAEQLIRDYLNRVSVAARTKLHSDDRRAFLARMRFSIERQCGAPGTADPVEVANVLASLGDPEKLVEAELARLNAGSRNGLQDGTGDEQQAGTDAAAAGRAERPGPRLGAPQGTPQRRRRTPSPWLVSGTGLSSAQGGAAGGTQAPAPLNPALTSRPPTGEIKVQSRPITSRWRPGEPLQPRQPRQPKQPKQPWLLRVARGGKAGDRIKAGDGNAGAIKAGESPAAAQQAQTAPRDQGGSAATGSKPARFHRPDGQRWRGSKRLAGDGAGAAGAAGAAASSTGSSPVKLQAPGDVRGPAASADPGAPSGLAQRPDSDSLREPGTPGGPGAVTGLRKRPEPGSPPGSSDGSGAGERPEPGDGSGSGGLPDPGGQPEPGERPGSSDGSGSSEPPGSGGQPGTGGQPESGHQAGPVPGPERDLGWIPGLGPSPTGPGSQPADLKPVRSALGPQLAAALTRIGQATADLWRGHPMEGTAVALLVLAGLIYPFPIWLVGFVLWTAGILLALASKIWDNLDKAAGVAAPVLIAAVGTVVALAMGGAHDSASAYAREVGATGPPVLRATVVLGGIYLAWRARRGPRSPNVPPWNRPHRI